ncbi:hypothetical protein E2562_000061 [Oryza meyeriana var. granulata]|uniref:Uncharacterized protein n=1 Tax=Oryza meyeriana var. granulata TaxID=110450 RepID=A0A6G1DBD9_9ORYZ|nr:hypothetical protein E2562_000061 [Oryza meyeriana var. granulata]
MEVAQQVTVADSHQREGAHRTALAGLSPLAARGFCPPRQWCLVALGVGREHGWDLGGGEDEVVGEGGDQKKVFVMKFSEVGILALREEKEGFKGNFVHDGIRA